MEAHGQNKYDVIEKPPHDEYIFFTTILKHPWWSYDAKIGLVDIILYMCDVAHISNTVPVLLRTYEIAIHQIKMLQHSLKFFGDVFPVGRKTYILDILAWMSIFPFLMWYV